MNILFDSQCFDNQLFGGVSRYHAELYRELGAFNGVGIEISIENTSNIHLCQVDPNIKPKPTKPSHVPGERTIANMTYAVCGRSGLISPRLRNRYLGFDKLKAGGFDIFHPTYYDPSFLKYYDGPFVLTIYDFIHEIFPDLFSRQENLKKAKRELAQKARRIIAISDATKKDAINYLGLSPDKIDVVHLGYRRNEEQKSSLVRKLPESYILFIGGRDGYKNFHRFLDAMAPVLRKKPDLYLLCSGPEFREDESAHFSRFDLEQRVLHCRFSEQELPHVYSGAALFVYPSLYEGFGLPILEAFASRCPAALSDIPVFHEIAGDAAAYFDPTDSDSITQVVDTLLGDSSFRTRLAERGATAIAKYSWEKTARKTLETYERALS